MLQKRIDEVHNYQAIASGVLLSHDSCVSIGFVGTVPPQRVFEDPNQHLVANRELAFLGDVGQVSCEASRGRGRG